MSEGLTVSLMRGGTSRGPVVLAADLPERGPERDAMLVALIGRGRAQLDGMGGGLPTTSKVVVIDPHPDDAEADIHYQVGNMVVGADAIDWAGTCGNMTSTVPVYAQEHGWGSRHGNDGYRLRNVSTGRLIDTLMIDPVDHRRGEPLAVRTDYLDPAGSVFPSLLPTGRPLDVFTVDGRKVEASVVDATHPYLFVRMSAIADGDAADSPAVTARIERLRGAAAVRLGLVGDPLDAMLVTPAVPRVVLVQDTSRAGELHIVAVSMGEVIVTVPVTAAMCAAASCGIDGTVVQSVAALASDSTLRVVGRESSVISTARVREGVVGAVGVERTARTIAESTVWVG